MDETATILENSHPGPLFNITEEELPIFLAETDEQLQCLDEGLVRLEHQKTETALLQTLFRAAHTLKGSAGMIGHRRMVDLTHALETVLDGVRKHQVTITVELVDACLQATNVLRLLAEEVGGAGSESGSQQTDGTLTAGQAEIIPLVARLTRLVEPSPNAPDRPLTSPPETNPVTSVSSQAEKGRSGLELALSDCQKSIIIQAHIDPNSAASAARAFQVMILLQEMGELIHMTPSLAQIETAAPVNSFQARLISAKPLDQLRQALETLSDITSVTVEEVQVEEGCPSAISSPAETAPEAGRQPNRCLDPEVQQVDIDRVKASQANSSSQKTIRTSVARLDRLMNLVGELITDRNRLYLLRRELDAQYRGSSQVEALSETISHISRITDQLQSEVMGIRMVPIANVFNKFPRLVRDLARQANKQIDLSVRGEDTELDRSVIEEIYDPLIHLLRNSVDHGIEPPDQRQAAGKPARGLIRLTAHHEQGRIILNVSDDGSGIDVARVIAKAIERGLVSAKDAEGLSDDEAVDLIFASGLSTAKTISDISGRGVGLDIVRNNIERLNGSVLVETWPGRGTQFQIVLPLTLAIVPSLLVRVGDASCSRTVFAIPLVAIQETLRIGGHDIQTVNARPVMVLRQQILPVAYLEGLFDMRQALQDGSSPVEKSCPHPSYVVVVRSGKSQLGLIVDALVGEQEVVVKSLSMLFGDVAGISSAAILGDGQVALILDVQGLFKLAAIKSSRKSAQITAITAITAQEGNYGPSN